MACRRTLGLIERELGIGSVTIAPGSWEVLFSLECALHKNQGDSGLGHRHLHLSEPLRVTTG